MKRSLIALPLLLVMAACGGFDSYVRADDAALGRVVVYRNGIAYFERRAHTGGDRLTLTVPDDKINDFLKSLNVVDAATGDTLPVSFPTQRVAGKGQVEMSVQLPDARRRDVVLTYITDAPAWKPAYRVLVGDKGKVAVQGWAVVDNTSGEDWQGVRVGVGSSSALSFRYDLRTVQRVFRETLREQRRVVVAPPRGGGVHGEAPAGPQLLMRLADKDIWRPKGHPDRVANEASAMREDDLLAQVDGGGSAGLGKASIAQQKVPAHVQAQRQAFVRQQQVADQRVRDLVAALKRDESRASVTIEGYADPQEADGRERALDRANLLRNRLIHEGIAPDRLVVAARGVVPGQGAGVQIVAAPPTATSGQAVKGKVDERPIGESHFESKHAMTVRRGTSAMVSVFQQAAPGEQVYLYAPEGARGNDRFAFKAVRFVNPTDSTLEAGPVTVYGKNRFIGEGLTDPVAPGSVAIVPFAMDQQIRVERHVTHKDRIARLLKLRRGALTAQVLNVRTTRMHVVNRSTRPATVYLRHRLAKGWKLEDGPASGEHVGDAHLFRVDLAAGEKKEVVLSESTPLRRTVDLRTPIGIDLARSYLEDSAGKSPFDRQMQALLQTHGDIGRLREGIANLRERVGEYRVRMDELHMQIASLENLRNGSALLRHLQKKMTQMSELVQQTTLEIVDHQEKLTMTRIRFQDDLSELSLSARTAEASVGVKAAM